MTKIVIDKALIEQALISLEIGDQFNPGLARATLRASLAEPVVKDCLTTEPAVEPVYQLRSLADGSWIDQTKESYDYNLKHGHEVRVLYAAPPPPAKPQPAAARSGVFGYLDGEVRKDMAGFYEAFDLTQPPPPAEVPLLSDREIKQIARESGLEKNEMSGEVLYALKCVAQEQAVRQNAGLK